MSELKINSLPKKIFLFNKVLLVLFIIYFCTPKIGLISIDKFEIRLLDIVSILISLIVLSKISLKSDHILYLSYFLISQLLIGLYFSNVIALLYLFRFIQYMLLGYGFYLLMISKYKTNFLLIFFLIQTPIVLMQYFHVLPNYDPGRGLLFSSQFSGTFGTPAEFSYFLISLVAIFLNRGFFMHIILSFFPLLSSVAFATLLMIVSGLKKLINLIPRLLVILVPYIILSYMVIFFIDLNEIKNLIADPGFDTSKLSKGYSFNTSDLSGPATLLMRTVKFLDIFVYILNNQFVFLLGCGYGCGYGAIDSGIIRLILEFGVLSTLFIYLASFKISKYLVFVLIAVNFIFDGFWSSHVAPILFAGIFLDISNRQLNKLGAEN